MNFIHRIQRFPWLLASLAALMLFSASGKPAQSTAIPSPTSKKSTQTMSDAQQADILYTFYNANKEKLIGNLSNAAAIFAELIRKDPTNAAAMFELDGLILEQGRNT